MQQRPLHRHDRRRLLTVAAVLIVGLVAGVGAVLALRDDDGVTIADENPTSTATTTPDPEATDPTTTDPPTTDPTSTDGTTAPEATDVEQAAQAAADGLGVGRLVVALDSEVVVVQGDATVRFDTGPGFLWADADYVYVQGDEMTRAWTLDGTLVCTADGFIDHVTQRADGTHVAAVQAPEPVAVTSEFGAVAYPLDAVDCATGERQAIEPVLYTDGEAMSTRLTRIADRVFQLEGDAEGNATIVNEDGTRVNGDDYSGSPVFSTDGGLVVYGVYGGALGPLMSDEIAVRDTTSGDLLWRTQLDGPFTGLAMADDRVVVAVAPSAEAVLSAGDGPITVRLQAYDVRTGAILADVEAPEGLELLTAA